MCWYCGSPILETEPIGRSLRCADCGKDLRCCKNCKFYLAGARSDCTEPNAEVPSDKERGNFCDWFQVNPKLKVKTEGEKAQRSAQEQAKSAFDALFS
ncbi:MAG: hypothetical protein LDL24_08745 [Treponema sp.]|nr:hypothetical protein [Treponema sp.]